MTESKDTVKQICFDVIGTCFHFDAPIAVLEERLSDSLKERNITAEALFFSLFYAAQRDFTYLSMVDAYTPIGKVIKSTVKRACLILGLESPLLTESGGTDLEDAVIEAFKKMPARPGLKELFDGLQDDGWQCVAVTNGARSTTLGYFSDAGIKIDDEHCLSCDDIKVAKPAAAVYDNANKHLDILGGGAQNVRWFVAAHSWDLIAARKAGFKTAYLPIEEQDPCTALFGEFDIYAENMKDLLKQMRTVDL
ncbi:HAD-like domain-containing protein [Protomyces lactucae-debilis]|uniref:HAD-like domain-containing protein n=1 Tax=Protomyces lactucae-debilis TaxID=2754530 RepID=A0A1Y2EUZ5_PROLT|nr:HAD-like domain-containing protein [Protomyces lactucae-debilis]ORY75398.1 HAD-like domain-containing protein [Protomyces lactucae-debilis]